MTEEGVGVIAIDKGGPTSRSIGVAALLRAKF